MTLLLAILLNPTRCVDTGMLMHSPGRQLPEVVIVFKNGFWSKRNFLAGLDGM